MCRAVARIDRVKLLAKRARAFLKYALKALEEGDSDFAVFSAEQALQLMLKAVLLHLAGSYPEIHSVRNLLGLYHHITSDEWVKDIATRFRRELAELEEAYTRSRYGGAPYSEDEARTLVEVARRIVALLEEKHRELVDC